MKQINYGEEQIGVFKVKYSLFEGEFEEHKLYNVIVDDILVGDISVHKDLNDKFNTYKSSFKRTLIHRIEQKESVYLSINGGLSGYYD